MSIGWETHDVSLREGFGEQEEMAHVVGNGHHAHTGLGKLTLATFCHHCRFVGKDEGENLFSLGTEGVARKLIAPDVCGEQGETFGLLHEMVEMRFSLDGETKLAPCEGGEAIDHDLPEAIVIDHRHPRSLQRRKSKLVAIKTVLMARARAKHEIARHNEGYHCIDELQR